MGVAVKYYNEAGNVCRISWIPSSYLEVPHFSSEYAELQNTSQQEIPPYSNEILVSPALFNGVNDTILQNLFHERIEKDTAWAPAGGFLDKEKRMSLLL